MSRKFGSESGHSDDNGSYFFWVFLHCVVACDLSDSSSKVTGIRGYEGNMRTPTPFGKERILIMHHNWTNLHREDQYTSILSHIFSANLASHNDSMSENKVTASINAHIFYPLV